MQSSNMFNDTANSITGGSKKQVNSSLRFLVSLEIQELLTIDPNCLDASLKNQVQDINLQLSIIYRDIHS
jgi:hypothetical protein